MPIIEARNLVKRFGAVAAADDVSVAIGADSVVGLIGANGAGKTTFINMITGYLKPDTGSIEFDGHDVTRLAPRAVTRLGICRSFQIPQLFLTQTVAENLLVACAIARHAGRAAGDPEAMVTDALERFALQDWADRAASVLPEGIRKLLDIAMALAARPKVLLLDEPTSGVSAEEKFGLMDTVMQAVRPQGVTVLFVEHDMDVISRYSERVLAFYEGRIIADGTPQTVLADAAVREVVVGEHAAQPPAGAAPGAQPAARGAGC
jgi:branched-chain amino acid transport system ATP-binding protein